MKSTDFRRLNSLAYYHLATLKSRQAEIKDELAGLDSQAIDREQLTRALESFDPIWSVLLAPEKERVLQLLIEHIDYDGETQKLSIAWRLGGMLRFYHRAAA